MDNRMMIGIAIIALIMMYFFIKKEGAATWTVYGTDGCGWTRKQLKVFDDKKIAYKYVNCETGDCKGATSYPTLVSPTGAKTVGFNNLESL